LVFCRREILRWRIAVLSAAVQQISGWTRADELMMSDIPWRVACTARRQCVWLTLKLPIGFLAIHDYEKPIQASISAASSLDGRS